MARVRIARIPCVAPEIVESCALQLVGSGFGEDLDPPETEFVVLGGKGILIDADFANGFFGRKLAADEAIDIDGAAVRPGPEPPPSRGNRSDPIPSLFRCEKARLGHPRPFA